MHQGSLRFTLVALSTLGLLVACSKDKDIDQPARLVPFTSALKVQKAWSNSVPDKGGKVLRLGLGLVVDGNRVFASGHRGQIAAFDLQTGRGLWRTKSKEQFSGGPGAGAGLVVVGTSTGDIVAVSEADGAARWRVRLNGEVLAAPAVSEKLVAVRTVDGKLHGLSPKDGHELWSQEEQVPRLSLRGTSRPVLSGDVVLCGFDNGKVSAVNMSDGSVQWSTTIAPPHGKTELERLDDVDAAVRVAGADVYAVGFQGRVAMLALDTGQIWWSHDASSYRGLGLDDSGLYISTADGEVVALRRRTGTELWRQKALLHRRLSAAVETDTSVVTGDFQGYVHWLNKATGAIEARERTGKVRISNAPVAVGDMVLVVNDEGRITAFRTTAIGGARAKASSAPAGSASPAAPAAPDTSAAPDTTAAPATTAAPDTTATPASTPAPAKGATPEQSGAPAPAEPTAPATPPQTPNQTPPPQTPPQPPPS